MFNEANGTLIRSNIFGTDQEANMRSYPELIDVGIMGQCESSKLGICSKAGVECYQNALNSRKRNMSLENYESILKQSKNKTFQIALGGAGDPNKHENFEEILLLTKEYGIIPNLTTSGYNLLDTEIDSIKKYCGAVAVSYYSKLVNDEETNDLTVNAIERFVAAGCITNIHYVISNDSLDEAIYRLENEKWPIGINAIIFILYKPVGLGKKEKVVKWSSKLKKFLSLAIKIKHPYKVGFDTCFTSALIRFDNIINTSSIDACEAARFSMYIDCEMNAYPCSFDNQDGIFKVSLLNNSILDAWNSREFNDFRSLKKEKCHLCNKKDLCNEGCKLKLPIDLCNGFENK